MRKYLVRAVFAVAVGVVVGGLLLDPYAGEYLNWDRALSIGLAVSLALFTGVEVAHGLLTARRSTAPEAAPPLPAQRPDAPFPAPTPSRPLTRIVGTAG